MSLFYSLPEKLFFYVRHSICEEGVDLTMKKVSLRLEDEILEILKILCGTDNVSEAVRIAILFYLQNNDGLEKVKSHNYLENMEKWIAELPDFLE